MAIRELINNFRRWLIELDLTEWRWPGDPGPAHLLKSYLAAGGTEAQFRERLAEGADEDDGM